MLSTDTLDLETNSRARADRLRQSVEVACGQLIAHRAREQSDSESLLQRARTGEPRVRPAPPPEALQTMHEHKREHYEEWADKRIPALGGLTPREAARTRGAARRELEVLLKDIEHHECRLPVEERYDVTTLRLSLGLASAPSRPRRKPATDSRA